MEKAFLQIGIQERERDVTRFLWLRDIHSVVSDSNLVVYRFCRVPFGLTCSPFLLGTTLKFHLQKEGTPLALKILNNMYVDNVLIGTNSVKKAHGIFQEAKDIFKRASMNLRQWNSNSEEFLKSLSLEERSVGNTNVIKVLGIVWDRVSDFIRIPGCNLSGNVVTKREVLHCIAKVFDPLGLLVPVVLFGKLFLQKLWEINQPWDEPLSEGLSKEWYQIANMLSEIPSLSVNRFVKSTSKGINQILIFTDASIHCYATAVYLRSVEENSITVNLVFAKTRLVPVTKQKKCKKLTVPRLELMGVLIGVRAANFVASELKLTVTERILWTDSQCVLYWLKTRKPLPVFVENRVREIRSQKGLSFHYIASDQNPSDCATRGLSVMDIKGSSLWWHGPSWLLEKQSMWPTWKLPELTSEILNQLHTESKESQITMNVNTDEKNGPTNVETFLFGMKKLVSSLRKLLRISVFVMRYIKMKVWNRIEGNTIKNSLLVTIFQNLSDEGPISTREIQLLHLLWIRFVQQRCFYGSVCGTQQQQET